MFSYIMPGTNDPPRAITFYDPLMDILAYPRGGTDEGAPGLRPYFGEGFYSAYVRDPDGRQAGFHVLHRTILRTINRGADLAPLLTARINGYVGCAVKLNKTFELIFRILDDLVRALVANYEQDDVETKFLVPQKNLFISLM